MKVTERICRLLFSVIREYTTYYTSIMDEQKNQSKWYGLVLGICLFTALAVSIMPLLGDVGLANPQTADTAGLWMNFLGRFHPLFLHLPIGATVLVLCMEILGLISFGKYKARTTLPLAFAASASVFAVVFGYFLYLTGEYNVSELDEHKRDGVIFTVIIIKTFLIKYSYDIMDLKWLKLLYMFFLLQTAGMLISAGHHGGVEKRESKRSSLSNMDYVIYTDLVHPILESKCISCHGPKKEKGGLRMDSIKAMLAGGEEEECLIPGDVENSFMITSILLPEDDDYHMPPKEKKQVTANELKILRWWIEIEAPETAKLSDFQVSKEITEAINGLNPSSE